MSSRSSQIGDEGEQMAADYLTARGYQILARKFVCQQGEIDIVAQKGEVLIFAEVKNYSEASYHDALDALTPLKIKKVIRAAEVYLWQYQVSDNLEIRFDVVAIDRKQGGVPDLKHIPDAFEWDR